MFLRRLNKTDLIPPTKPQVQTESYSIDGIAFSGRCEGIRFVEMFYHSIKAGGHPFSNIIKGKLTLEIRKFIIFVWS